MINQLLRRAIFPNTLTIKSKRFIWATILFLLVSAVVFLRIHEWLMAPSVKGCIDEVAINGEELTLRGWAGSVKSDNEISRISVWLGDEKIYEGEFERYIRPDVAKSMARKDWLMSGWIIKTTVPINLIDKINRLKIVAKLNNGKESKLLPQRVNNSRIVKKVRLTPYLIGFLNHSVQLTLLFSLLFILRIFPNTRKHENKIKFLDFVVSPSFKLWFYRAFFFFISLAGVKFLLMKFFLNITCINFLTIVISGLFSYFVVPKHTLSIANSHETSHKTINNNSIGIILLIVCVTLYLGWLYKGGIILPAHDPIAVPTFASILYENIPLSTYYEQLNSNAAMYPPGFPLLLSFSFMFLEHIEVLVLFKLICILSLGMIPLSWAWFSQRVFNIPLSLTTIAIAFYIAGYGIERTLNYSFPFAGKNAQILLLSVYPIFFLYLAKLSPRNIIQSISMGFLFFCVILFHYSAIYLSFVLFIAIFVVRLAAERGNRCNILSEGLFIGITFVFGVVSFVIFSYDIHNNLRNAFNNSYDFFHGFKNFIDLIFGIDTELLATFNSSRFQTIAASPMRGYLLIISLTFSAITFKYLSARPHKTYSKSILLCSSCCLIAIFVGAALSSGLVPSSLTIDFYRWFIFPLQIGVLACTMLSAIVLLKNIRNNISVIFSAIFLILPASVFITDTVSTKKIIDMSTIPTSQLRQIQDSIVPGTSGCGVLAQNVVFSENITYVQKYKIVEYVEMLTGCRLMAGSWLHGPLPGWRQKDGLPDIQIFNSVPIGMNLYFIGSQTELNLYGENSRWEKLKTLNDEIATWKRNNL